MKILTWDTPNFGDRLNEWVWPHYLSRILDNDPAQLLVGIGSLLNHRLPPAPTKWILGSGVGHGDPPVVDSTWRILWVRGPRSAAELGLPRCRYITDGAVLLRDILKPEVGKRYTVSFIPHCSAVDGGAIEALQYVCETAGVHLINPHWPVRRVLDEVWASQRISTEALHGAIVADAFRIPWIPVFRHGVFSFKWIDWTESMGLEYRPHRLPYRPRWLSRAADTRLSRRAAYPILRRASALLLETQLRRLARSGKWQLSKDNTVAEKVNEMKECVATLESQLRG